MTPEGECVPIPHQAVDPGDASRVRPGADDGEASVICLGGSGMKGDDAANKREEV